MLMVELDFDLKSISIWLCILFYSIIVSIYCLGALRAEPESHSLNESRRAAQILRVELLRHD